MTADEFRESLAAAHAEFLDIPERRREKLTRRFDEAQRQARFQEEYTR